MKFCAFNSRVRFGKGKRLWVNSPRDAETPGRNVSSELNAEWLRRRSPSARSLGGVSKRSNDVRLRDLAVLKELPLQRFLVTSGFRRLQESKVRALGFADWFAGIYSDALDEPNRRGKHGIFQDILSAHGLGPDEVLVVGDNPDSEIEAGNRLGMKDDSDSPAGRAAERSRAMSDSQFIGVERVLVSQRGV
jgi:HAD superfamily hydrolase (TIGR01549 family)